MKALLKRTFLIILFVFSLSIVSFAQKPSYLGQWENNQTIHTGSIIDFIIKNATYIEIDTDTTEILKYQIDYLPPEQYTGKFEVTKSPHEIEIFIDSISDRTKPIEIKEIKTDGVISVSNKEQYLFIGDSLWEGTNNESIGCSSYEKSIPYQIAEELDIIPITVSAPGSGVMKTEIFSTIEDMAFQKPINANPTKIFLSIGTNDVKIGVPSENEKEGLQHLVDTLHSFFPNAKVYILVPLYEQSYSDVIHSLEKVNVIETADLQNIEYTDGIHPNEKSAKKIARKIVLQLIAER